MDLEKLNGYIILFGTLIALGKKTFEEVAAILRQDPDLTNEEINHLLVALQSENTWRRARSAAIAFG